MSNFNSVFASNILGILTMGVLFLSKGWRIRSQSLESRVLLWMIFSVILGCVGDQIAWVLDGRPGRPVRVLLYFLNTILFMLNSVVGLGYISLIVTHINEKLASIKEAIAKGIEHYNNTSGKPYQLSASVGGDVFNLKDIEVSEFMNGIDRLMYAAKEEHYKTHERRKDLSDVSVVNA